MKAVGELYRLGRLAVPIMLAQLSQMGMGVADTIMAGRVSAADLAGVTLGGNLFWPPILLVAGVILSVSPTVSQLHGGGHVRRAGEVVRQAVWIALAGGSAIVLLLHNSRAILDWVGVDPVAIPIATAYAKAISWGVLPLLGFFVLRYLCDGLSWTLPAMLVALTALALKIPLNLLFIHGGPGVPAMGGVGCGYATAIVMAGECVAMMLIVGFSRMRAAGVFQRFSWPDWQEIGRLVRLGAPIGAANFMEVSLFAYTTLLIGRLGVEAVAAHQIANNVAGLAFMVPLGVGMAASVRVGFNVGKRDLAAARRSGHVALFLGACFAISAATLILFTRHSISGIYTGVSAVSLLAAELLLFVAVLQLVDNTQVIAMGALRGYKDTGAPMALAAVAYWGFGFPIAVSLGFGLLGLPELGVHGFWVGSITGLCIAAVCLVTRLYWLSRRTDRVWRLAHR